MNMRERVEAALITEHEPCCTTIDGDFAPDIHKYAHMESSKAYFYSGQCYACDKPWPCSVADVIIRVRAALEG